MSDENTGGAAAPAPKTEAPLLTPKPPKRRAGRPPHARMQATAARPGAERPEPRPEGPRLQRKRRRTENRFHIDPALIPPGMSWEWKAEKVLGQQQDDHLAQLRENHFKPVDQGKHPSVVVRKDGMILMERPLYLTQDAKREDLQAAIDQVRSVGATINDTPSGTMTRNHPSARANTRINRGYDIPIAGDDANYQEPT